MFFEHNNTFYNWNDPFNWFLSNEWKKQNGVRVWNHATPTVKWNIVNAPIIKISLRIYFNIDAGIHANIRVTIRWLRIFLLCANCSFSLKYIQSCFDRFCVGLSGWEWVSGWSRSETGRQGERRGINTYLVCLCVGESHVNNWMVVLFRRRRSHGIYFVEIILMSEALA